MGDKIRKLDFDQLDDVNGGTYDEAMAYLKEVAHAHGWDPRKTTYVLTNMSDEEYAKYEELYDHIG